MINFIKTAISKTIDFAAVVFDTAMNVFLFTNCLK